MNYEYLFLNPDKKWKYEVRELSIEYDIIPCWERNNPLKAWQAETSKARLNTKKRISIYNSTVNYW